MKKIVYNPLVMLLLGLAAGALTRLADIHTQILCSVFSEFSVWILVGVVIVLGCDSRRRACLDIFLFCAGMLITYYLVAEYTNGIWGWSFVYGWAAFTLLTPVPGGVGPMTRAMLMKNILTAAQQHKETHK